MPPRRTSGLSRPICSSSSSRFLQLPLILVAQSGAVGGRTGGAALLRQAFGLSGQALDPIAQVLRAGQLVGGALRLRIGRGHSGGDSIGESIQRAGQVFLLALGLAAGLRPVPSPLRIASADCSIRSVIR